MTSGGIRMHVRQVHRERRPLPGHRRARSVPVVESRRGRARRRRRRVRSRRRGVSDVHPDPAGGHDPAWPRRDWRGRAVEDPPLTDRYRRQRLTSRSGGLDELDAGSLERGRVRGRHTNRNASDSNFWARTRYLEYTSIRTEVGDNVLERALPASKVLLPGRPGRHWWSGGHASWWRRDDGDGAAGHRTARAWRTPAKDRPAGPAARGGTGRVRGQRLTTPPRWTRSPSAPGQQAGALYQHFPGKLELYLALLETHVDELVDGCAPR